MADQKNKVKASVWEECVKRLAKKDDSQKQIIPTIERHFACVICNKKFVHKGSLMRHLLIHTGEKPHSCELLNKIALPKLSHSRVNNTSKKPGAESCVFPFVFTSTGLTSSTSKYEKDAPLLYSLKHGTHGLYATPLSSPNILAVQIVPSTNQTTLNIGNAYSNKEVTVDRHVQVQHIKREIEDTLPLNPPIVTSAESAESSLFPLVFTPTSLTSSTSKYEKDAPLLYSLKHGTHGLHVTSLSTPNILAVQIPSTNQITLNIKSEHLNMEVTLDSHVQIKHIKREIEDTLPLNPPSVKSAESMPVILDVSSCKKIKRKTPPQTYTSNGCISSGILPTKYAKVPSVKSSELKDDEDYQFLMSLLPELKQLPLDQKTHVKKKMKDFVLTSRLCCSRIRFENSRSNIYRDCGVLPSLRDWKF